MDVIILFKFWGTVTLGTLLAILITPHGANFRRYRISDLLEPLFFMWVGLGLIVFIWVFV